MTTDHLSWLCHRDMDRETTYRLLRESIVFLCKTHLGYDASGGFEVDAIICVSRRCGDDDLSASYDDPRPTVFKFHERVTDEDGKAVENVGDWLLSGGSSGSFVDGLLKQSDLVDAPPATKRRRTGEQNAQPAVSDFGSDNMHMADLSLVKQEPGCSDFNEQATVRSSVHVDAAADPSQTTRRLRSADAAGFDVCYGTSHTETPSMKGLSSAGSDSRPTAGITELEKLVAKPVLIGPPPLKPIPNVTELRRSGSDELIKRPSSRNSNSEQFSETVADFSDENADDSTGGMEQSTPRSCDLCGLVFADFPTFNVHCATVHGRYACPFCALLFPCESTRERHLFEHTGEPVDDDGSVDIRTDESEAHGGAGSTRHSEFGKQRAEYWSADASGSVEMSDAEDGCLTSVNGTLYDPQVVTRRGVLSCQTLRAIAQLDPSHPFVCDVCRARFATSSDLCDHCTSAHHRIPCPYCGRSFSQKASMERHMRQHTGERPYHCTLCNSSYTRKENLQTHMTRMHGSSATPQHLGSDFICVE